MPNVVHLTDSPFFGGPERQILGLSVSLPAAIRTTILTFRDNDSSAPFREQLARAGVDARALAHGNPQFLRIVGDIIDELRRTAADVLVCHGYKADVLGWLAARRVGIPVIAVSRGWTGHTRKVRLNEGLDQRVLRRMDAVVCVSEGQAAKVRRAGVRAERVHVIRNAIDASRFGAPTPEARTTLAALLPEPCEHVVIGVGRLSPEKGFDQLVEAARLVVEEQPRTGFVIVGDGPERDALARRIREAGLEGRVVLAGFRADVDRLLPAADILAQSSYTEGLPNVVLEACAAGVPVVATAVGGTGEVLEDGVSGHLVSPGDPRALAARVLELLRAPEQRLAMGERGRERVRAHFSFPTQSAQYERLLRALAVRRIARPVALEA